jgi:acetoacetyl-CoA synthetase
MNERILWHPSESSIENSNLNDYLKWLLKYKKLSFANYDELWTWSVAHLDEFWESIWQYFDILHDGSYNSVLQGKLPYSATWFDGTSLNYAEHVFLKYTDEQPAIIFKGEATAIVEVSWKELREKTASLQDFLRNAGITESDCVAGYLPCIPEATVSMLATVSLGATWTSCSPDFGTTAVIDRFAQIKPKVLIAANAYTYGGKSFDKTTVIKELAESLPSVETVVFITPTEQLPAIHTRVASWQQATDKRDVTLKFNRVSFAHPLWILYSSGTTGLPKAFVHSHGGILLEQLKYASFHNDFKVGDKCFWYTTTGWMMWNYIHGSLLTGSIMVLYDGSVAYPDLNALWRFAADTGITHFGTSAAFLLANMKAGIEPEKTFTLPGLRSLSSTGSTLPPEGFEWVYDYVKKDLWLVSMSGGSDVCSAFVGGNPTLGVRAGQIQCRALGCNLQAFNEQGQPVTDEVGEMVICSPMPSMPVYFWNDPGFVRYQESYFQTFPGVWRHGDWIKITPEGGIVIYGRSDATLNRAGVRIGTSEVYRAVDKVPEVKDSLIICVEESDGSFWMPLFVVMKEGFMLTADVRRDINKTLKADYSPRHVPDEIIAVADIPYTISGKKTETPVKKIFMGKEPAEVISAGALKNPASMEAFVTMARDHRK